MSEKLARLAERRKHLVVRAAQQRAILAQNVEPWRAPLARVDMGLAALRFVGSHPVIGMAGGAALLAVLRLGRRPGRWLSTAWIAWRRRP